MLTQVVLCHRPIAAGHHVAAERPCKEASRWVRKLKRFRCETGSFVTRKHRLSRATKLDNELPHSKILVHKQPAVTSPPQQQPLQVGRGRFTLRPVRLQGFDPLLVVSVLNHVHKFLVRDRSGITQPLSNLEPSPTSWPRRCLQAGKRESHARRN